MGYYLFYLLFAFIICLAYGFSFYLYLLLEFSVKQKKKSTELVLSNRAEYAGSDSSCEIRK